MYINKLDDFFDITINNFYNFLNEKNGINKLNSDLNFVSFQNYIINLIKEFIEKKLEKKIILEIINNESNISIIIEIVKRYVAYYLYLSIAYVYEGERDIYTTNIIESSKNQKDSTYQIENFFNSENNAKLISFFNDIRNLLTVIKLGKTIDQIKIILNNNPVKFESTINLINKLGEDYIIKYFLIKDNMHNILKTIIFKLLYLNEEKEAIIKILNQEEEEKGEYKYIEVVYSKESKLIDFTLIQKFLDIKQIKRGLAEEIYTFLEENRDQDELNIKENKDFVNYMIKQGILIPITEDFLRYHKDSEKYESDLLLRDNIDLKERDATKIKYIINKMSKIRNYYSKIYEKNPKLKLDAQKLFYKQLEHKDAVLYNDNEESKIIKKLEESEKTNDLDHLIELENLRKYAYVNFKNFSKDGFKMRPTKTVKCLRYTNIKYKDSRNRKLEFRMGSDSLDINVVGLAWNPTMIPLDCFNKDNLVNVTDIVNTKNGFLAFKNVMEKTFNKNNRSLFYWLFDMEKDKPNLKSYINLSSLNLENSIYTLIAELYKTYYNSVNNKLLEEIKNYKELNNYQIENIINKYKKKYIDYNFDLRIKNSALNYSLLNKMLDKEIIVDEIDNIIPGKSGKIIKLPKLNIEKKENNIILLENEEEVNNNIEEYEIIPVCHHHIKWKEINKMAKLKNDEFSQNVFNFVIKYVRQNENNINICKSCGEMLNIGKYVYEGTYVKELDTFLTTSLAVGQDLNKIPKYAKYNRTIKNIEKNIEKFAFIINLNNYLGNTPVIKLRRKMVVKDTIDLLLIHTEYLRKQPKTRNEDYSKKYGINKGLTNLFFFELKDDIFLTSSNEIDKYKVLKYNNIVTYFIFIMLTELNTGQIFGLKDEKSCNYFLFTKFKDNLFGKLYIRMSQKEKIPALKLPLLCYVIYYMSFIMTSHHIWFWNSTEDKKGKFNPIIQSTIINTLFDLFNSIFEADINIEDKDKNYLYQIIATRFREKLKNTFNDTELFKRIEDECLKKIKIDKETKKISYIIKKIPYINFNEIKNKNINELDKINDPDYCDSLIKNIGEKDTKVYSNELNPTTNCPDGKFHKWEVQDNDLVCSLCKQKYSKLFSTVTSTEEDYQSIINQLKYEHYKKLLNEYCISGDLHDIDNNICKKCNINPDTHKYTDKDIIKFEKNINENKEKKYFENIKETQKLVKKIEEDAIKTKKIINKFEKRYKTNTNNKLSNYVDDFIQKLSKILDNKIKIRDNEVYLKDTYYFINHDYLGTETKNTIKILKSENKVILEENNKDFEKDILYYKDRTKNVCVYYDANTLQYLGYKENNKLFKQKSYAHLKIFYSIRDMTLLLGVSNNYYNIEHLNNINNNNSTENTKVPIKTILENLVRLRVTNLKQIIGRISSIIFRIRNQKTEKSIYSNQEKDIVNRCIKTIKKFNTKNEDNSKSIFKHWKYISNKIGQDLIPDNIKYEISNNYINVKILDSLNNLDSKLIFFLIYNFNRLLDYNSDKNKKSTISLLIIELIQYSFNMYLIERDSIQIRKFESILSINAPELDLTLRSSFDELVNSREIDDKSEGVVQEIDDLPEDVDKEEMLYDMQEEMDALDYDDYEEDEPYMPESFEYD